MPAIRRHHGRESDAVLMALLRRHLGLSRGSWLLSDARFWLALTALAVAVLYLSTVQLVANGSQHAYATDVGEIQNALPRWGTIHYPGYPLYSLLGSSFVALVRLVGVPPAAGASLFSALWGVAVALLAFSLARELGVGSPWAALGAVVSSLVTSLWVDASVAEIHTMALAFILAVVYFALRFGRDGRRGDLLGLAFAASAGAMHERSIALLAPCVVLLIWPRRADLWRGLLPAVGVAFLGPLAYLYLPLRAWQGAGWVFGDVGTWRGLSTIFLDTKVERIVALPSDLGGWLARAGILAGLLHEDLWLPALGLGLVGLWLLVRRRDGVRVALALTLAWAVHVPLALVIWEGRVSDALLAAKLPIVLLAGIGLAVLAQAAAGRRVGAVVAAALLLTVAVAEVWTHRPAVLAITRDPRAQRLVAMAEQVVPRPGEPPATFMALWGHSYWALTYAQAYEGRLAGLRLVDHNADLAAAARNGRLFTFSETLYQRPLAWWDKRVGRVHLSSPAPGIVELSRKARAAADVPAGPGLDLENGIRIASAGLETAANGQLVLTVYWEAERRPETDYSVGVHLLSRVPPEGPGDILAQADREDPVDGWFPTTRWQAGEVVEDTYVLAAPAGSRALAARIGMYRVLGDGQFENTPWLTLPIAP